MVDLEDLEDFHRNWWFWGILAFFWVSLVTFWTLQLPFHDYWCLPLLGCLDLVWLLMLFMAIHAYKTARAYWFVTISFKSVFGLEKEKRLKYIKCKIISYIVGMIVFYTYSVFGFINRFLISYNFCAFFFVFMTVYAVGLSFRKYLHDDAEDDPIVHEDY